jgi:CheY-like chemotaxis protein
MIEDAAILLVEDSQPDVLLMQNAFGKVGWKRPLIPLSNGQEAQDYLEGKGRYADRTIFPYPSCVLLDLQMPKMDGLTLLIWIRAQPLHKRLLVFILTAEQNPDRLRLAYDLAANCLLAKPGDLSGTVKLAASLKQYLNLIQLPPLPDCRPI